MNKIDLSLFETKGDLMEYFDKNFANSTRFNRYFLITIIMMKIIWE